MSKATLKLGRTLAAAVVAAGAVTLEAASSHRASVSGVKCGYTVTTEATAQCPQGQQCNPPQQATGTLTLSWEGGGALTRNESLSIRSPRDSGSWVLSGSIKVGDDLPEGKTASGSLTIGLDGEYKIENVKVTVTR